MLRFCQQNEEKTDKDRTRKLAVMSTYPEIRVTYEIISTILCFILVWFMMKPYFFTRDRRYTGLPIAFGLLGASYFFSAITYTLPSFAQNILWLQLVARTFAFMFLAATYYFSNKPFKTSYLLWKVTFSLIVVAIIASFLMVVFAPQFEFQGYLNASLYARIFILICLTYIIIHVLRSHMIQPESTTLLIPLGYILLAISQYSLIIWAVDASMFAFWGALAIRWWGLAIFLFVTYLTFYRLGKKTMK
jgi:hypothetical protein